MNTRVQGYRNGTDVVSSEMMLEIINVFSDLNQTVEKYAISDIRGQLIEELHKLGWSDKVYLSQISRINITGEKNKIGLCIQTGNVSRMYADLLKLQALFLQGVIKGGIIIVPTLQCAKTYAVNAVSMERLYRELEGIFNQVITIPLVVIGFSE